ncbi:MAG: nicotinate-nucleotide diphosphorylase (carboxylating), partial [Gemmatimonadaceae bacterium]|nr:nicotinate-nucleotide diphosphorylase (carboxylating) [Gemmatimonadaceae bacterium]
MVSTPRVITPDVDARPARGATPLRWPMTPEELSAHVRVALDEDAAFNDVSTIATVRSDRRAHATLVARRPGVVAGVPLAVEAFRQLDPAVVVRVEAEDGTTVAAGQPVLALNGHARGLLSAERTALNYLQHLSGVATITAHFVARIAGTAAHILDTRKTTPGWRQLEKYAVRAGGGTNHR